MVLYRTNNPIVAAVGVTVITLFGVAVFVKATNEARESESWPTVQGVVRDAKVVGSARGSSMPEITYEYLVGDQAYSSDRYAVSSGMSRAEARRVVAAYPSGTPVTVYYSPSAPDRSVLVTGYSVSELAVFRIGGGVGALAVIGAWIAAIRAPRRVSPTRWATWRDEPHDPDER